MIIYNTIVVYTALYTYYTYKVEIKRDSRAMCKKGCKREIKN